MNEVLQWAVMTMIVFLLLGLFRQIAASNPARLRRFDRGLRPGERLPVELRQQLGALAGSIVQDEAILAFVTENCVGCQRLWTAPLERIHLI